MSVAFECIRCHIPMERGYLPDYSEGNYARQKWVPGEPQPSRWSGLKFDDSQTLNVTTFRCPKCGYLESHAIASE